MKEEFNSAYEGLFEKALIDEMHEVGVTKTVKEGVSLIEIGQTVSFMPLIINGAVKILQEDQDGNDLILYFIEPGSTCAMTLNCCMGNTKSEIRAVAEIETHVLMIPIQKMDEWIAKYPSWRKFVFNSYHNRFAEMLEAIDTIAFMNMDERIIKYLGNLQKVHQSDLVHTTHQDIAYDLHTSRVVVSRLLKKLENKGIIELNRNSIRILNLNS